MASVRQLKIVVVDGGKSNGDALNDLVSSSNKKQSGKKATSSTLYKVLNFNETIKSKITQDKPPTAVFATAQAVNLGIQATRQYINYYVTDIGRSNGDSNHQAMVNHEIEKVTDMVGIGMATLGGAQMGSALGPIGALVGAGLGLAGSLVNLHFRQAGREREYAHEVFKDNNSQVRSLARANNSLTDGRVRLR